MKIRLINKVCIFLTLLFYLSACSPRQSKHGTIIDKEYFRILKDSTLTKPEVAEILGPPSIKGTFSDNTWYYISHVNREFAYFQVKKIDQIVIKIRFTKNQEIKYIQAFNKKNGKEIKINKNRTFTKATDSNILQELLGNVGKYNRAAKQ